MSQINSNTKDDFQVVFQLSCFVGHPVPIYTAISMIYAYLVCVKRLVVLNRIVYIFIYLIANFSRYLSTLLSFNLVTFLSRNLENQEFLLINR